ELRALFRISGFGFGILSVAASPGFAPSPSVSKTDALLITPRGRKKWGDGLVEYWSNVTKPRASTVGSINPLIHYSNTPFSRWSLGKVLPLRFLGVGQM